MPTMGLGALWGTPLLVAFGLFLFGLGMGGGEVAMNVEAAEIEEAGAPLGETFEPDPRRHETYREAIERQRRLYDAVLGTP